MGTSQKKKKKMERLAIRFRRSEAMLWAQAVKSLRRKAAILKNQANGQY